MKRRNPRIYITEHVLVVQQHIRPRHAACLCERPYGPKTDCGVAGKVTQKQTLNNKWAYRPDWFPWVTFSRPSCQRDTSGIPRPDHTMKKGGGRYPICGEQYDGCGRKGGNGCMSGAFMMKRGPSLNGMTDVVGRKRLTCQ